MHNLWNQLVCLQLELLFLGRCVHADRLPRLQLALRAVAPARSIDAAATLSHVDTLWQCRQADQLLCLQLALPCLGCVCKQSAPVFRAACVTTKTRQRVQTDRLPRLQLALRAVAPALSIDAAATLSRVAMRLSAFRSMRAAWAQRPAAPVATDPRAWWRHAIAMVIRECRQLRRRRTSLSQALKQRAARQRYSRLYERLHAQSAVFHDPTRRCAPYSRAVQLRVSDPSTTPPAGARPTAALYSHLFLIVPRPRPPVRADSPQRLAARRCALPSLLDEVGFFDTVLQRYSRLCEQLHAQSAVFHDPCRRCALSSMLDEVRFFDTVRQQYERRHAQSAVFHDPCRRCALQTLHCSVPGGTGEKHLRSLRDPLPVVNAQSAVFHDPCRRCALTPHPSPLTHPDQMKCELVFCEPIPSL